MATTTPNLGMTLPSGSENHSRATNNANLQIIDTAVGNINSALGAFKIVPLTIASGTATTKTLTFGATFRWKKCFRLPHQTKACFWCLVATAHAHYTALEVMAKQSNHNLAHLHPTPTLFVLTTPKVLHLAKG